MVKLERWEKLDEKEVEELMKSGWKVLKLVEDDGLYMRWKQTSQLLARCTRLTTHKRKYTSFQKVLGLVLIRR